jgi:hypothetical protein
MTVRWDGKTWRIKKITASDNNYDMGSLWITSDGDWHLITPTGTGPQAYNPGGEIVHWINNIRTTRHSIIWDQNSKKLIL